MFTNKKYCTIYQYIRKTIQVKEKNMDKILNYVAKGKGVGSVIIMLVSVIFASFIAISMRNVAIMSVPYIQMAADEVLPITVENGIITTPSETKKVFPVFIDDNDEQYSFIFDTTNDTLDTSDLESGIYLTRSHIYVVDNEQGKITSKKLKGNFTLEKKDYTDILKSNIKWIVMAVTVMSIIIFFITYFILNIFYAYCASIAAKIANKSLNFDVKMRLSAICLSFMLLASFGLKFVGINIGLLAFFALVISMQIFLAKKLPQ